MNRNATVYRGHHGRNGPGQREYVTITALAVHDKMRQKLLHPLAIIARLHHPLNRVASKLKLQFLSKLAEFWIFWIAYHLTILKEVTVNHN